MEDLGYVAWSWCVSSHPSRPPATVQAAQVCLLLNSYGIARESRSAIVPAILERQSRNIRFWQAKRSALPEHGLRDVSRERIGEIIEWSERERLFVAENASVFLAALSRAA